MPFILYPRPKAEGDDDVHEQSRLVGDCCRNGIMDISYEKGDMVALTRGSSGYVRAIVTFNGPPPPRESSLCSCMQINQT